MIGSILNTATILVGGIAGLTTRKQLSPAAQSAFRTILGVFTIFVGLKIVWDNLNGSLTSFTRQFIIILLALTIGRLVGRALRLQKISNHLGQFARERITAVASGQKPRWSDGFNTCAALFCAAPLAVLGAPQEGLSGQLAPFAVKAVMDGLAAASFAAMFGWSVALAALPVFVYQGTLTLLCSEYIRPFLEHHHLLDSVNATGGMLVVFVALVIFEIRKIELADYLPALAVAPLLTWLWH